MRGVPEIPFGRILMFRVSVVFLGLRTNPPRNSLKPDLQKSKTYLTTALKLPSYQAAIQQPPAPTLQDPMVHWYGPLIRNPYKPIITPLKATYKTGAHSSEPFKGGKGPYHGPVENLLDTEARTMGGGNGQKSATARARKQAEKDAEKAPASKGLGWPIRGPWYLLST